MLIGYARILKSEAEDTTPQVDALKAAGCEKPFAEFPTGGRRDRPQLKQMLDDLRPEDVVVVTELDRIASSLGDLSGILNKINNCGAYFRSLRDGTDKSGDSDRILMQMVQSIGNFERTKLRTRTAEGQEAACSRGNGGGQPTKLAPAQQREILDMLNAGRSAADLARLFRVHRATISRLASKARRSDSVERTNVHQKFLDLAKITPTLSLGPVARIGFRR
ncbi:recombinase family protein [Asticcacaulis excentricus]|uniref:Resolvase domain protein n=1 Tax=Asticcacaulis excentricus (strain ATCC 15261 / DSM 4724 / KCTC 12464 / NCIMB 9791 / VKM B-1370 / CB 48) TaxID=573065 RepID=E8RW04_ASTEC|nr:recombinase family protein [Asticcacaulis excentricus]ADU15426.1 Resolvase domain protein [Asticcacaulis excentricus CB 48]